MGQSKNMGDLYSSWNCEQENQIESHFQYQPIKKVKKFKIFSNFFSLKH